MGFRIVRKKKKDKIYTRPLNGAFAWDCQWKQDDDKGIPRILRGTKYLGTWKKERYNVKQKSIT